MTSLRDRLKHYLPNSNASMALVAHEGEQPFAFFWPVRLTQIIGGKTWSISIVRFTTEHPSPMPPSGEAPAWLDAVWEHLQ